MFREVGDRLDRDLCVADTYDLCGAGEHATRAIMTRAEIQDLK
jgi:hypothetical protein